MELLMELLRHVHVLAGALGLLLFWLPIFSRKGSPLHRRAGRYFLWCVYLIGSTSLLSVSVRFGSELAHGRTPTALPLFGFMVLLAYLGVTVLVGAWYMRHVLIQKHDLAGLRRPLAWWLIGLSALSSAVLFAVAWSVPSSANVLLYALSPLGLLNSWTMSRHLRRPDREPRAWFFEHMGHGIGLGIAFHAAFFVFGARVVFAQWLVGFWGLLPWLAPVVIGVTANMLWERYYRRRWAQVMS
ncbi:MAG: hypothetical protein ACOY3E_00250 [Pseudomonadota bacterium]